MTRNNDEKIKNESSSPVTSILIVDDHQGMLNTLADILIDENYQVSTASSGNEAVMLCQRNKYQVIIMDVRMPRLGGVETLRLIKAYTKDTRIIMMSAYAVDELKYEAMQEGAVAFVQKPIDVESIIRLVERVEQPSILLVSQNIKGMDVLLSYLNQHDYRAYHTDSYSEVRDLVQQIFFSVIVIETDINTDCEENLHEVLEEITPRSLLIVLDESSKKRWQPIAANRKQSDTGADDFVDTDRLLTTLEAFWLKHKAKNLSEK
ncbi:MAG: response regulator [Gammaproteobacteria bacterium]|nr:response regulator [Gammaproteobacteria bacterium]